MCVGGPSEVGSTQPGVSLIIRPAVTDAEGKVGCPGDGSFKKTELSLGFFDELRMWAGNAMQEQRRDHAFPRSERSLSSDLLPQRPSPRCRSLGGFAPACDFDGHPTRGRSSLPSLLDLKTSRPVSGWKRDR
ncbi:hypothetical protein CRENBAI_003977 [Crenichthys baileyi]|uniref:Uncharacterized protein n=1 Tax=Crenichthys baileyi TaxID=28760 RepID=A0AAV9RGH1_9TELE